MWPEGTPSDLQTIMSLQNLKKQDQQIILESFLATRSTSTSNDDNTPTDNTSNNTSSTAKKEQQSRLPVIASNTVGDVMTASVTAGEKTVTMMASSMRNLTSTARNAVGDLSKVVSGRNS
jgi:hypothetical protein